MSDNITIVSIPHHDMAQQLAAKLIEQGRSFQCHRSANGWEFIVINPTRNNTNEEHGHE